MLPSVFLGNYEGSPSGSIGKSLHLTDVNESSRQWSIGGAALRQVGRILELSAMSAAVVPYSISPVCSGVHPAPGKQF